MPDKFEKFTERARKVLTLAQEETHRLNHNSIGTEHLLLGLVREGDGVAARVLSDMGVDLPRARVALDQLVGRGESMVVGEVGLTPRAKKAIELAVAEARRLNHHSIGTEHLLLGLIRERDGTAMGVLQTLGIDPEALRSRVDERLSRSPEASERRENEPAQIHALMGALAHALRARADLAADPELRRRAVELYSVLGEWLEAYQGSGDD